MSTDNDLLDQLKIEVVDTAKKVYNRGLNQNNEGNVSIRIPRKEEILITPTANIYETLTKDQIVHLAFDGTPLSSGKLPSTEVKLHLALYKARPKVQSVIHTHSEYCSILSIVRKSIPVIMEEQIIYLGGSIDLSKYGEAHTDDLGQVALDALGYKNAALLASHGAIACGKSSMNALKNSELAEKFAKMYWGALQIGEPKVLEGDLSKFYKMFKQLFANCPKKLLKELPL